MYWHNCPIMLTQHCGDRSDRQTNEPMSIVVVKNFFQVRSVCEGGRLIFNGPWHSSRAPYRSFSMTDPNRHGESSTISKTKTNTAYSGRPKSWRCTVQRRYIIYARNEYTRYFRTVAEAWEGSRCNCSADVGAVWTTAKRGPGPNSQVQTLIAPSHSFAVARGPQNTNTTPTGRAS